MKWVVKVGDRTAVQPTPIRAAMATRLPTSTSPTSPPMGARRNRGSAIIDQRGSGGAPGAASATNDVVDVGCEAASRALTQTPPAVHRARTDATMPRAAIIAA